MSDQNLNIHIIGLDEFSTTFAKLSQLMNGTKADLEQVGRSFKSIGKDVSQIGGAFALMGTSLTAPLLLAFNNASKYSADITRQIDQMKNQWDEISLSIGTSLLPVMQSLTNLIEQIVERWNSLSQAERDNLVQVTFLVGQYVLLGGIAFKVFGEIIKTVGEGMLLFVKLAGVLDSLVAGFLRLFFFQPQLLAMYAVIGGIALVVIQWKEGLDYIADAIQKIWDLLSAVGQLSLSVWSALKQDMDGFIQHSERANELMDDFLTFKPGQHGELAGTIDDMKERLNGFIQTIQTGFKTLGDFGSILNGKGFGGSHQGGETGGFWDGFLKGAEDARIKMQGVFQLGQGIATDAIKGMQATWQSFFEDTFTGQLRSAEDYFVSFGNSLIKTFTNALAQMATNWLMFGNLFGNVGGGGGGWAGIIGGVASIFGNIAGAGSFAGGYSGQGFTFSPSDGTTYSNISGNIKAPHFYHTGGPVVAHDGLAMDEVPAVLQTGEGVLSRRGMENLARLNKGAGMGEGRGPNITIAPVIQLWDASDIQRNKRALTDAITEAVLNNEALRTVLRRNLN